MHPRVRALVITALTVALALAASLLWLPRPLLLWNASSSSPIGLYSVSSVVVPRAGEMVVAWPPPAARPVAAARSYLPFNVPLVKRVAAIEGDRICARSNRIFINGRAVATRRRRDPSGRPMPWWSGCVRLERGDLFLLSFASPLAFDGRYFGVTHHSELFGEARLLWPR